MTPEDICGNCGAPIPRDSATCPNCPPPRKKIDPVSVFLVIAVLCSSLLMLTSSVVNVATVPAVKKEVVEAAPVKDMTMAAYEAAQRFVEERYPGPKRFSELYQSSVEQNGNAFTVTLSADDLAGSAPVRYFFSVEMEMLNGAWSLKEIKR